MDRQKVKIFFAEIAKIAGFIGVFIGLFLALSNFLNLFNDARMGYHIILTFCAIIATFIFMRLIEGKPLSFIGLQVTEYTGKDILFGFTQAFLMITFIFIIQIITGSVRIVPRQLNIMYILVSLVYGVLIYFFVAISEEILFRGYIFQRMIKAMSSSYAIAVTALVFGIMHYFNPDFSISALVNIILAGIWFSVAYLKTNSLWAPIAMHFTWNFFQGVIYGMPVSGITIAPAFFTIRQSGKEWLSGGAFGPEGSVLASLVLIIGIQYICSSKLFKNRSF